MPENTYVRDAVNSLQLHDAVVHFPVDQPISPLQVEDYLDYFAAVQKRLKRAQKPAHFYETLVLGCADDGAAISGLNAYLEKKLPVFFKSLTLDLSELTKAGSDHFITHLQNLLKQASHYAITQIKFEHADGLSRAQIEALVAFICDKDNQISIDCVLPAPYQFELLQQRLDKAVGEHQADRQQQKTETLEEGGASEQKRVPRKRTGQFAKAIDIEVQQAQQQEVVQEQSIEFERMVAQHGQEAAYTIDTFREAWQSGRLGDASNSHYLDGSRHHIHEVWCNWVGAFNRRAAILSNIKITPSACDVLLRHHEQFQMGIDLNYLPAGFTCTEQNDGLVIDFDARLKRVAKTHPLALTVLDLPEKKPLPHSRVDELVTQGLLADIWHQLNQAPYHKKANTLFRQYLPELLKLDKSQQVAFFELVKGEDELAFHPEQFQFLLDTAIAIRGSDNPPAADDKNLLMQLEKWFGTKATKAQSFIQNHPKVQKVAKEQRPEDREAQEVIAGFSGTTKKWWDKLFSQHCMANQQVDLPDLVKKFISFKFEVSRLLGQEVELPEACEFKDMTSMPLALSRMVSILKHVDARNRKAQLNVISGLDLSSTGVIKLAQYIPGKSWAFFTPEMKLSADEEAYLEPKIVEYQAPDTLERQLIEESIVHYKTPVFWCPENLTDRTLPYRALPGAAVCYRFDANGQPLLSSSKPNPSPNTFFGSPKYSIPGLSECIKSLGNMVAPEDKVLGEAWEDYQYRVRTLMQGETYKALTESELRKILDCESSDYAYNWSGKHSNAQGLEVVFLPELPKNDNKQFANSLIYVRPQLYYVTATGEPKSVGMQSENKFETYISERMLSAKEAFERNHQDATPEELARFDINFDNLPKDPVTSSWVNALDFYRLLDGKEEIYRIRNSRLDKSIAHFFRYAAQQPRNRGIPLELYQYIHDKISKQSHFSGELKQKLYMMLAGSLENSLDYIHDLEATKVTLEKIIALEIPRTFISTLAALVGDEDGFRRSMLGILLYRVDMAPPLPVLEKLIPLLMGVSSTYLTPAFGAFPGEKTRAVYQGMREYTSSDYAQDQSIKDMKSKLFIRHMGTVNAINTFFAKVRCDEESKRRMRDGLHALISTFRLHIPSQFIEKQYFFGAFTAAEFDNTFYADNALLNKLEPLLNDKADALLELVTLLQQIDVKQSGIETLLTQANFEAILEGLPQEKSEVKAYLEAFKPNEHKLLEYFPGQKIEASLESYQVPQAVESKIKSFFTETRVQQCIRKFLIQFSDAAQFDGFVDVLIRICKKIPFSEREAFVSNVLNNKGFFSQETTLDPQYSEFVQLLRRIDEYEQQDILSYFAESSQALCKQSNTFVPELSYRVQVYLDKIDKQIQKIPQNSLNNLELVPSITQTLLKTPVDELHREGCSLLFHTSLPEASALSTLNIPKHSAYIYADNTLCYVNKARGEYIKKELTSDEQEVFKQLFFKEGVPVDIPELSDAQLDDLSQYHAHTDDYSAHIVSLYTTIDQLIKKNPGVKVQFLDLFNQHHAKYDSSQGDITEYLHGLVETLEQAFDAISNKNLVIALCLLFKDDAKTLQELLADIPVGNSDLFAQIAVNSVREAHAFVRSDFKALCDRAKASADLMQQLKAFYHHPPYPDVAAILAWHEAAERAENYSASMQASYDVFDKAPFTRSDDNGFYVEKANAQLALIKQDFKTYDASHFDSKAFYTLTHELREKTTDELLVIFKTFNQDNPGHNQDIDTLVAVTVELLYRSTGMELNTTQYLALLAMFKSRGHVTAQMITGEGKSRVMMASCACQFAMGKTVDFVTSDMYLAARDFVTYQPLFDTIGAPTKLIFAETPPELYQKRGINFSDPTHLILFRNRARSMQKRALVIDDNPKRRCLQLDEADKTYFDSANSRYNFSDVGDPLLRDMPWVYRLLVTYFIQDNNAYDPYDLFQNDIDRCRETFLQFAKNHPLCIEDESRIDRLEALSNEKIEEWQTMAFIAMQQKYLRDFEIRPDQLIQTDKKLKMSSETVMIIHNDLAEHSKLSFGADQCQKEYLNYLRENPDKNSDPDLKKALAECHYAFHVPDEKQIIYSSTSKNFLDDYEPGEIKAVTGTFGAMLERIEASQLYTSSTSQKPMSFINMPRERGLHRRDRAIHLTADNGAQLDAIVAEIKLAISKNQPVLIIAEDSRESKKLYEALQIRLDGHEAIQLIEPKCSAQQRKAGIKKAGEPGQVTVSTGTLGRGTDIKIAKAAEAYGLLVVNTFLPPERDQLQFAGRSARYGQNGEYIAILDKQRLKRALGKTTLADGFYTHTEDYVRRELAKMDKRSQTSRLLEHTVGDFRKELTDKFFKGMADNLSAAGSKAVLPLWSSFFAKSDQLWNVLHPQINDALAESRIDDAEALLGVYHEKVIRQWDILRTQVAALHLNGVNPETKEVASAEALLEAPRETLRFSPEIKALLQGTTKTDGPLRKIKFYDHYDPAHDGRAVKYTHWSIPLVASLKGWANLIPGVNFREARRPFANLIAWFEGRGQMFADFLASENKASIVAVGVTGLLALGVGLSLMLLGLWVPIACAALIATGATLVLSVTSGTTGRLLDDFTDSEYAQSSDDIQHDSWQELTELLKQTPESQPTVAHDLSPEQQEKVQIPKQKPQKQVRFRDQLPGQRLFDVHEDTKHKTPDNDVPEQDIQPSGKNNQNP